jgi:antitoxin (DNA-binding transcriptional repressor) of toxin-antitoxin stability system
VRAVGLKVLKNKLSEYVRLVASGETVLVTDRDRVVAEIVPPRGDRAEHASSVLLADAARRGWVRPAVLPSATPPRAPVAPFDEIQTELHRDRGER